jgi:hypothetical protein
MKAKHEVEVTLSRYLLYSKTRVLASLLSSDRPAATLHKVLASLPRQNQRYDLDVYTSRALFLYTEGVKNSEPLPVILAKIETHRRYVLNVLHATNRKSRQPSIDSSVYCSDHEYKIRMLLKNICARHLRVFLLSYRKSIRRLPLRSPRSETFPAINENGGRIAPAA